MSGYTVVCPREECGPRWCRCRISSGHGPLAPEEREEWLKEWGEEVCAFLADCRECTVEIEEEEEL